jgi:predicted house-cleaning noncanonical NTP pyrophosphatase (MazG superfamily)
MNDDQVDDLKQFMTTLVRNEMTDMVRSEVNAALDAKLEEKLEEKLEQKFEEKLRPINQKIDDLTTFVQDAITTSNDVHQEQLNNHEQPITKLEHVTA